MTAQDEVGRLRALAEIEAQSALLQAMRASAFEDEAKIRAEEVEIIRSSTFWRMTAPIRTAVHLVKTGPGRAKRAARTVAREGLAVAARRVRQRLRPKPSARRALDPAARAIYEQPITTAAGAIVAPRVLLIAELSLPQCAKYRVWQKQAHFERLGTPCTVLDWENAEACRSALQSHALAIFYRVPGRPKVLGLIAEAKRLGVPTYWETDDLIFDLAHYQANRNLETLDPRLRDEVLGGVALFRAAMLACERTIASTDALAERMREAGGGPSVVIENALDQETMASAGEARARPRADRGEVVIAYGSGSKAHDADFAEAAPALAEVMRLRPSVRLLIIGNLKLPAVLEAVTERIDRRPAVGYAAYLGLLGSADVSLAPLEATAFNDAKSNIKWMEAAILGVPSVCSPRSAFAAAIEDGGNGFLADDAASWRERLLRLVDDPALRARVGEAALASVLEQHGPERVARRQVAPLVAGLDRRRRPKLRVLAVNIFFAPVSFGGATIVAEQMARHLHAREDTEIFVFASRDDEEATRYVLLRYEWEGVPVFAVQVPKPDAVGEFDNPEMASVFADVLRAVGPDVVHFHCVQHLGAGLLRTCEEAGIPFAVTVHDAWWLCARQFMVTEAGGYCFQRRIDLNVCQVCMPTTMHLRQRFNLLTKALAGATLVLSPSEAHRQLYLANGLDPARTRVNHNGIRMPDRPRRRRPGATLRFGFVGGVSELKGYHLVHKAFEAIASSQYELVLVDNTLNLGFSSIDPAEWNIRGKLSVLPAYRQDTMDDFFDGIDVLLFPSQWKESFGLVVAEALARDVWVIVTEGGGAAEFVVDGENGTVLPLLNDPRPLRMAAEALLADPAPLMRHLNPYKHQLRTYEEQAVELHRMLSECVATVPVEQETLDHAT
ncbi:MAG: glycosyltransferase [Acetobacteraceae bacterium]|nr:glycosyltransferase [Acetobacteraceae bacterium]